MPAVGLLGHSLGGYAAVLTASLHDGIDCVVCANPSVAPSHMFWRDGLFVGTRYLNTERATQEEADRLLRPVLPLVLRPRVAREGRVIFGSVADRIIPASEPNSLWRQGTHFGVLRTLAARSALADALRDSGVLPRSVPDGEHNGS